MSIWQFILLLSVAYAIGLVISHKTTVMEQVYWSGYELERLTPQGNWTTGNRFNIASTDNVQDLRFTVTLDHAEKWQRPIGLMLGGPFAAEVTWDGETLGAKGKVGDTPKQEIPGPIDTVLFVPLRLLQPGQHEIRMRLSTQHLIADDASVFHFIRLAPYRENGRRALRYYATPLVILSALLVFSFQSFRIGNSAGNPMHIGLGLFGFSVVILLMSEIFRAVVNYPYHYHELRGVIGWFANTSAGLALIYTCFKITKQRWHKYVLYGGLVLYTASYLMPMESGDLHMAQQFILLIAAPSVVFAICMANKQISYLSTLPLFCLACLISCYLSVGLFLDSFQFVSALILIGGAWAWVYVDIKEQHEETPGATGTALFHLKTSAGNRDIPVTECIALKGEGNYTTLLFTDGTSALHQDGIGAIMDTQPKGFVRVHKSYAVNIAMAKRLRSATGSKYWLDMPNDQKIPVSRYRALEVRGLLEDLNART